MATKIVSIRLVLASLSTAAAAVSAIVIIALSQSSRVFLCEPPYITSASHRAADEVESTDLYGINQLVNLEEEG